MGKQAAHPIDATIPQWVPNAAFPAYSTPPQFPIPAPSETPETLKTGPKAAKIPARKVLRSPIGPATRHEFR